MTLLYLNRDYNSLVDEIVLEEQSIDYFMAILSSERNEFHYYTKLLKTKIEEIKILIVRLEKFNYNYNVNELKELKDKIKIAEGLILFV